MPQPVISSKNKKLNSERNKNLWTAVKNSDLAAIDDVLKRGADINSAPLSDFYEGIPILWLAVISNKWNSVEYLIECGANIYLKPSIGAYSTISILDLMAFYNKLELIKKDSANNKYRYINFSEYEKTAKKFANYRKNARVISSMYDSNDITYLRFLSLHTEEGFAKIANKIFSHLCDDEHAKFYDGEAFFQSQICLCLRNSRILLKDLIGTKIINIFNKVELDLIAIEDGCNNNDFYRAEQLFNFFNNESCKNVIIPCPVIKHAMIAKLIKKHEGSFLYIYNDGEGYQNHKVILDSVNSDLKKIRFASSIAYKLPSQIDKECSAKIIDLFIPTEDVKTEDFYNNLNDTASSINAIEIYDGLHATTGQRSGTCSLKSIFALLQDSITRGEYLLYKFLIKVLILSEYYSYAKTSNKLSYDNSVREQILGVCENVQRLKNKVLDEPLWLSDSEIKAVVTEYVGYVDEIKEDLTKKEIKASKRPKIKMT